MKKIFLITIASIILFGCSSNQTKNLQNEDETSKTDSTKIIEVEDPILTDEDKTIINGMFDSIVNNNPENEFELLNIEKEINEYGSAKYIQFMVTFSEKNTGLSFEANITNDYKARVVFGDFYNIDKKNNEEVTEAYSVFMNVIESLFEDYANYENAYAVYNDFFTIYADVMTDRPTTRRSGEIGEWSYSYPRDYAIFSNMNVIKNEVPLGK